MIDVTFYLMGEKFNLSIEEEFFEFVKEDLQKLQKITTPKELLSLFLEIRKEDFENKKALEKIFEKIEKI